MASGSYNYSLPPFFNADDLFTDSSYPNYNAGSMKQAESSQDQVKSGPLMSLFDYTWGDFTGGALSAGGFQIGETSASLERSLHVSQENHTPAEEANPATSSNAQLNIFTSPVEDAYWANMGLSLYSSLPDWLRPFPNSLNSGPSLNGPSLDHLYPFAASVHREADSGQKTEEPSGTSHMPDGELSHSAHLTSSESISTTHHPSPTGPNTPDDGESSISQRAALQDATNRVASTSQCPGSPKAREPANRDQPTIVPTASSDAEGSTLSPEPKPEPELPAEQDANPSPSVPAVPTSARRNRRVTKRSVVQPSPAASGEPRQKKTFSINVRKSIRRGRKLRIEAETIEDVSCCDLVGDKGLCKFTTTRDGVDVICNQELPRNDKIVRKHLAIHLEELGYLERATAEGNFEADCPWCGEKPTLFDGLTRHILYTELKINAVLCECGGTNSRNNQKGNKGRHENSERHQAYLKRKALEAGAATKQEGEVEREGPEEETLAATKEETVEERAELSGGKRAQVPVEVQEEFVQGSSRGVKRRRSI